MKRFYILSLSSLLFAWAIGFFIFHGGPAIHTLIGLAIVIMLQGLLKCEVSVTLPSKMVLELKYFWYQLVIRKNRRQDFRDEQESRNM
jgi:hypothetical protein